MAVDEYDPFTQVYQGLWDLLEADTDFNTLVPDTDVRVKYEGTQVYHDLDEVNEARPYMVAVVCKEIHPGLEGSSNGTFTDTVWTIEINTAWQGTAPLFRLAFVIMRAMREWREYLMNALLWNDQEFIWDCTPGKAQAKLGSPSNKGIKGWTAVWEGSVRMHFKTETF